MVVFPGYTGVRADGVAHAIAGAIETELDRQAEAAGQARAEGEAKAQAARAAELAAAPYNPEGAGIPRDSQSRVLIYDQLSALRRQGHSRAEAAEALGLSDSGARRILASYGRVRRDELVRL